METLAKLFSSATLVKVMRLFLFHPYERYTAADVVARTKSDKQAVAHETKLLVDIGFLKRTSFFQEVEYANGETKKKRVKGFALDESFPHLAPLKSLVLHADLMDKGELGERLSKAGRMKLVVASGIFVQEPDCRIDLLVVGERIRSSALASVIRAIESAVGSEVRYTTLAPAEFEYRSSVRDRLIRDVFDYPHVIVKNTLRSTLHEPLDD